MKTAIHEIDSLLVEKENASFFTNLFVIISLKKNLFFEYEWNSFYQHHFESLLNFIFSNTQGFPLTIKHVIYNHLL